MSLRGGETSAVSSTLPMNSTVLRTLISSTVLASAWGCSSEGTSPSASGGDAGTSQGGSAGGPPTGGTSTGGTSADANVGTFFVTLNPSIESTAPYTSIDGKVYSGETPADIIETPVASGNGCTTYVFSRQPCVNVTCSSTQKCAGPDDCRELPALVGVGAVSVTGVGPNILDLSEVNKVYQYAGEISYPGFEDGAAISLSAGGDFYPAFDISTTGVAPVALHAGDYVLSSGEPLLVEWEPGTNPDAGVTVTLNISRHGGSDGYLQCDVEDSGSLIIPAEPIRELIALGVAGFPQLIVTRRTRAEAHVTNGRVALEVSAIANPTLAVEGYCSCFDSSDCGSCSDTTKSVCDSVRRVCISP
jgi:hypothetical protein